MQSSRTLKTLKTRRQGKNKGNRSTLFLLCNLSLLWCVGNLSWLWPANIFEFMRKGHELCGGSSGVTYAMHAYNMCDVRWDDEESLERKWQERWILGYSVCSACYMSSIINSIGAPWLSIVQLLSHGKRAMLFPVFLHFKWVAAEAGEKVGEIPLGFYSLVINFGEEKKTWFFSRKSFTLQIMLRSSVYIL